MPDAAVLTSPAEASSGHRDLFRVSDAALLPVAEKVRAAVPLSFEDGQALARSRDIWGIGRLANAVRERLHGNVTYYNRNRHIKYTNVCALSCKFCSFYRKSGEAVAYEMPVDQVISTAQKAYSEGALALALYCARLVDEQHTGAPEASAEAALLLEVLTPIAKSFPSQWCLEANSLAIQVHGGYGYTRDFPVEQYWRDNRLNMIHEGTHGIQAADLLGRKVLMEDGRGLQLLAARITDTIDRAARVPSLAPHAKALAEALQHIGSATRAAWATGNPQEALANAVPYMQAFGHTVLAWIWLDVAEHALGSDASKALPATGGRVGATDYFFHYELPKIGAWLQVVERRDPTCTTLPEEAF